MEVVKPSPSSPSPYCTGTGRDPSHIQAKARNEQLSSELSIYSAQGIRLLRPVVVYDKAISKGIPTFCPQGVSLELFFYLQAQGIRLSRRVLFYD